EILLTEIWFQASPVISIDEDNNLHVFWGRYPGGNAIFYMIYTAETDTWGPTVKWETNVNVYEHSLTCFYKQYNGYTGLAYTTYVAYHTYEVEFKYLAPPPPPGVDPAPGEPGSPGAPEPTPEPEVVSNTLTASGSRHTTPTQGSIGTTLITKRTRLVRHITWLPVVIVRA
ncbi:unnamed protein product, partial [marine sediment metagenome]